MNKYEFEKQLLAASSGVSQGIFAIFTALGIMVAGAILIIVAIKCFS